MKFVFVLLLIFSSVSFAQSDYDYPSDYHEDQMPQEYSSEPSFYSMDEEGALVPDPNGSYDSEGNIIQ